MTGAAAQGTKKEGHQRGESKFIWKLSSIGPSLRGHSLEILPRAQENIDLPQATYCADYILLIT